MKHLYVGVPLLALVLLTAGTAAQQTPEQQQVSRPVSTSYLFIQSSTPVPKSEDLFRKLADDVQKFLRQNGAALSADPTGMNSRSFAAVPLDQVLGNAKKAGAAMALYGTIDVPGRSVATKLVAYTLDGNKMWEAGGSCDMGVSVPLDACVKVSTETMYEMLKFRIRQQDLPLMAEQNK